MLPNFHILKVSCYFNKKQIEQIKIKSVRFKQSIALYRTHNTELYLDEAILYLRKNGFNIVGKGMGTNCFYLVTDTFKALKEPKTKERVEDDLVKLFPTLAFQVHLNR